MGWLPGCAVGGQRYAATAEGAVKAFCVNAINAEINSAAVAGGPNPQAPQSNCTLKISVHIYRRWLFKKCSFVKGSNELKIICIFLK